VEQSISGLQKGMGTLARRLLLFAIDPSNVYQTEKRKQDRKAWW
jgi:hypothetical protein